MRDFQRKIILVSCLVLGALAIATVLKGLAPIATPYLTNYGENTVLVNAWGLTAGYGLYRVSAFLSVPAFVVTYTPFLHLLVAAGIKIWGISYIPGRLILLLALFGCGAMIAGICRRLGCSVVSAVSGALAFLGTYPVFAWSGLLRVDVLAVFFELAAVFVLLGINAPMRRAAAFVILATFACYTK